MGKSSWNYWFQVRRDWPLVVQQVASHYNIHRYGVAGVSNGGPYVMACLTHPATKDKVGCGVMIVAVSDVMASGYFSVRHFSGFMEGLYNSLPVFMTAPLNYGFLSLGSLFLVQGGGYKTIFKDSPTLCNPTGAQLLRTVLADGAANLGLGASIDCQQGLSPLTTRSTTGEAQAQFAAIIAPVRLWYGTQDSSVPMASAEWLQNVIPNAQLFKRDTGHGLYFFHTAEVLDDWKAQMEAGK